MQSSFVYGNGIFSLLFHSTFLRFKLPMILQIVITSLALTFSAAVTATTLTFDELVPLSFIGASYESSGFVLTGTPMPNRPFYDSEFRAQNVLTRDGTTSTGLFMGGPASKINLNESTGALFNAISIDLDESWVYQYSQYGMMPEPVSFTGTKGDGTKVYAKYSFTGIPNSETFVFGNEFQSLQSLQWAQGAIGHTFDNVNVELSSSVSEPSTMWLFLPLVAALSLWSWKRNHAGSVSA